jgi:hypothetical protein
MKREPVTLDEQGRILDGAPLIEREPAPLPWYAADTPQAFALGLGEHAQERARAQLGEIVELAERGVAWAVVGGIAYVVAQQLIRRR